MSGYSEVLPAYWCEGDVACVDSYALDVFDFDTRGGESVTLAVNNGGLLSADLATSVLLDGSKVTFDGFTEVLTVGGVERGRGGSPPV